MVPGPLKERLEGYLARHGLKGADIPLVLGTFSICKGLTTVMFVGLGVRYRPLSGFIRRSYPALMESMSERMQQEFSRTKSMKTDYAKALRKARDAYGQRQQQFEAAKESLRSSGSYQYASKRLRKSETHLSERIAEWYVRMSDKYSDKLATNWLWTTFSRIMQQEPRQLAKKFGVGVVEGLILNKLLLVLTAPVEFYLVMRYFQMRRALIEDADPATPPSPHDGTGTDNRALEFPELADLAAQDLDGLQAVALKRKATLATLERKAEEAALRAVGADPGSAEVLAMEAAQTAVEAARVAAVVAAAAAASAANAASAAVLRK